MDITFLRPIFLVLLLGIPLLWFVPRRVTDRTQAAVRSLVFVALVTALARPVLVTSDGETYHVLVADHSASISDAQREQQDAAISKVLKQATSKDKTSLVVVGGAGAAANADAQRPGSADAFGATIHIRDEQSQSPLSAALAAAVRQIPDEAPGVIHVFSDGLATDRRWAPEVQQIIERGIAVNTYDLGRDDRDVYPAGIETDDVLRVGQTAHVEVEVLGAAKGLRVTLLAGGEEIAASAAVDSTGRVTVPLTFEPKTAGFLDVTAQVLASEDSNPRNNELRRGLAVQDPLRLLYLGDRVQHAATRIAALLGRGFEVTDGTSRALNEKMNLGNPGNLDQYDLVLLDDRPASRTPDAFQRELADAVRQQGLGLVFSGGKSAFGTGGYDKTPMADIVPVDFVQRTETRDPSTALALIIDTSGSMVGHRIELAKQVARLAVRRLKAHDRVGIVEFYGNKHWTLPLQSAANKISIDRAIGRMQAIGGTVLRPALEEAYYGLKNVETRYKHVLVVTDAGVEESDYEAMIRLFARDGVTVSTALVGAPGHNQFMIDMASWGRGRFYSVNDRYTLPELVLKQPSTMKLPPYRTGTFNVRNRGGEGWWSDIDRQATPALDGYVETTVRPGAEVLMEVEENTHPLLATWRYGLGRVTALMTEPVGEGTRQWNNWSDYGRALARVITRTANDAQAFDYDLRRTDHDLTITARRQSRDGTLFPQATVLDAQDRDTATLEFRRLSPDHFETHVAIGPSAPVRVAARAVREDDGRPLAGRQLTRLISTPGDEISAEQQVDPRHGLDLEGLASVTRGQFTDRESVATGKLSEPASNADAGARTSLSVYRLWPILLVIALALYLAEIVHRRLPRMA